MSSLSSKPQTFQLSPTFDLNSYISRYEPNSETRLQRLLFIARKCSKYAVDSDFARGIVTAAYSLVEKQLKDNYDTQRYQLIFEPSSTAADSVSTNVPMLSPGFVYDHAFVTQTDLASTSQLQTLEACLTTAQAHLAKDSIRLAHLTLVDFYKVRGDLSTALKYALRARDYCTLTQSSIQVHMLIIELLIHVGNYNNALEFVAKTELLKNTEKIHGDGTTLLSSKLNTASALAHLEQGRYQEALSKLLSLEAEFNHQFNSVLSAEDIALYGGILALATLSRNELYSSMLDINATFKERLELVPLLRDAIQHYARSEYRQCLSLLYSLRPELELDVRFCSHLDSVLELIRDKCLMQFFTPYSVVSIQAMADCIGVQSTEDMEIIVANLILSGKWDGVRINARTQTLHAITQVELEKRRERSTYQKVIRLGEKFMAETQNSLLRLSCIENGVLVKDDFAANKTGYSLGLQSQSQDDLIASYMSYDSRGSSWYGPSHRVARDAYEEDEEDVDMMDREDSRRYYK